MITSSEQARMRSSRMIKSFVRAASTTITRLPALWKASTIGSKGATPTPPPAQTTVPTRSIWVACPSGPTTSVTASPSPRAQSFFDDRPTACTTSVIVPRDVSAEAMVSGMRSPCSPTRTMTKCPALRDRAISGASTSSFTTWGEKCSLLTILFISRSPIHSNKSLSRTNMRMAEWGRMRNFS